MRRRGARDGTHCARLFALACLLSAYFCARGCRIALEIVPAQSTWTYTGTATVGLLGELPVTPVAEQLGLQGRLFLDTPQACPLTQAQVLSSLSVATLTSPNALEVVNTRLWPTAVNAVIGEDLGTFSARYMELSWSAPLGFASGVNSAASGTTLAEGPVTSLKAEISGGLNAASAPKFGLDPFVSRLPPLAPESDANLVVTTLAGGTMRFTFSDLSLNFAFKTIIGEMETTLDLTMVGTIVADAVPGCGDCGFRGACALSGTTPACACDCGWSGADCSTPSGFCEVPLSYLLPGNTSSIDAIEAAPEGPTPAPIGTAAPSQCEPGFLYDPNSGGCTSSCQSGLKGYDCDICSADARCKELASNITDPLCNPTLVYDTRSTNKTYSCNVPDILGPDFKFICTTQPLSQMGPVAVRFDGTGPIVDVSEYVPDNMPEAPRGLCRLHFELGSDQDKPIQCLAWGCLFQDGSGRVKCERTQCECLNGCPEVVELALPRIGGDVDMECNPINDRCTFDIEGLPIQLDMECTAGECTLAEGVLWPDGVTAVSSEDVFAENETTNWDVVLSGIPLYLAILATLLLALLTVPRMWTMKKALANVKKARNAPAAAEVADSGANETAHLEFDNVSLNANGRFKKQSAAAPVAESSEAHGDDGKDAASRASSARSELHMGSVAQPHSAEHERQSPLAASQEGPRTAILSGVNGSVSGGDILAVLGPSGCGKSSLLAILAQQRKLLPKHSKATGNVKMQLLDNGCPEVVDQGSDGDVHAAFDGKSNGPHSPDAKTTLTLSPNGPKGAHSHAVAARRGFVQQHDCLMPTLTVTETLLMAVMLRDRNKRKDLSVAADRVSGMLSELRLTECADRLIGDTRGIRGVSGGERRRASIGMELLDRPHILILDEVTSGLDSYIALKLVQLIKGIAERHGCAVIMSVHQPSQAIFSLFDKLLLLHKGHAIYSGPSEGVDRFLSSNGLAAEHGLPIADYLLQVLNEPNLLEHIAAVAHKSRHAQRASAGSPPQGSSRPLELAPDASNPGSAKHLNWVGGAARNKRVPILYQMGILTWRGVLDIMRNPSLLLMTVLVSVIFGVFAGLIFWELDKDIAGVQNRAGCMFFSLMYMSFFSITSIDSLLAERDVVLKEVGLGYYWKTIYVMAKCLLDALLLRILPAFLFGTPLYFMAGLQDGAERYLLFVFILSMFAVANQLQAMVIVEWIPKAGVAMVVYILVVIISALFSGFLANADSINVAVRWIRYLSIISFAYQALAINEFQGNTFDFVVEDYASVENIDGAIFAEQIGIHMDKLTLNICVLLAWVGGLFLVLVLSAAFRDARRSRQLKK